MFGELRKDLLVSKVAEATDIGNDYAKHTSRPMKVDGEPEIMHRL